jgi:geranylgeranyl transferase type-2 subunit beta
MASYLEDMTFRLAAAMADLPESLRACHAAYLSTAQQPDGGFAGREGGSDLYYTGFALRGLALLGELYGPVAERAVAFLRQRLVGRESVLDLLSLIYGAFLLENSVGVKVLADAAPAWREAVAETLEALRRDDGGYARTPEGRASSTYHSFLVLLCLQFLQRPVPDPQRLVEFILAQRGADGGFRELRVAKRSSTNPTAAAIGVLRSLNALDADVRTRTIAFLADMQTDEGGFRANTRIPIADLLSTFTGVLTLVDLGGLGEVDQDAALRYAEALQCPAGGFHGAAWDLDADVEYTFYGLGCLALLQRRAARGP